jgi:hypothetical protein
MPFRECLQILVSDAKKVIYAFKYHMPCMYATFVLWKPNRVCRPGSIRVHMLFYVYGSCVGPFTSVVYIYILHIWLYDIWPKDSGLGTQQLRKCSAFSPESRWAKYDNRGIWWLNFHFDVNIGVVVECRVDSVHSFHFSDRVCSPEEINMKDMEKRILLGTMYCELLKIALSAFRRWTSNT